MSPNPASVPFAVVVAPLNVVGRIAYVMGKEGVIASSFGRTHDRYLTPHRGLMLAGALTILVDVILVIGGSELMNSVVWVDTYGTFGYMLSYTLVAIAGVVYSQRMGMKNSLIKIAAVVAVLSMAYVFFANIWPVPDFPVNILPYLFLATMILAFLRLGYVARRHPAVIGRIGMTHTEMMEGVG